jgi:hypothetical protein
MLGVMLGCANAKISKTKSEIISSYEEIKPSITYYVDCFPQRLVYAFDSSTVFLFDDNKINDKIGEILSNSDLFSSVAEKYYFKTSQDKEHLDDGMAHYHFKIAIRWAKRNFIDSSLDAMQLGIWVCTAGLAPRFITNKIEMDIYVTSQDKHLKTYHYEDSVINVQMAPIIEDLKTMGQDCVPVFRAKCLSEVENMMKKFIKDFSNEWCQKYHSKD